MTRRSAAYAETGSAERRMIMNQTHAKNNRYKNGEYNKHFADRYEMSKKQRIKEPTMSQVEYRDALYKFCLEKGVIREGFLRGRTRTQVCSNISAFITILRKNGLADEFYETQKQNKE